jgi:hypothetical protein
LVSVYQQMIYNFYILLRLLVFRRDFPQYAVSVAE